MNRFLVFSTTLILLVGCVPMSGDYYNVNSHEGTVVGDYCGGSTGPAQTLRLQRGSSAIKIVPVDSPPNSLVGSQNAEAYLFIEIDIPIGESLASDFDQPMLYDENNQSPISGVTTKIFLNTHNTYAPIKNSDNVVLGDATPSTPYNQNVIYHIYLNLDRKLPDGFIMRLPAMQSSNAKYPEIVIKYKKTSGTWFSAFNC